MAYYVEDLGYLICRAPYLALATQERAQRFLGRQLDLAEQCFVSVASYPGQQVESLEFFYATLRGLGSLDATVLSAMCTSDGLTWRGVVWGGWLALIRPRAVYEAALAAVPVDARGNHWAARCALSMIRTEGWPDEFRRVEEPVMQCRALLSGITPARRPLRHAVPVELLAQAATEKTLIAQAYRMGDEGEVQRIMGQSVLKEWRMSYPDWLHGAASPTDED